MNTSTLIRGLVGISLISGAIFLTGTIGKKQSVAKELSNKQSELSGKVNLSEGVLPNNTLQIEDKLIRHKQVSRLVVSAGRTVTILGEMGGNAMAAADRIRELSAASEEPIYLILSSPGGSVLAGAALISAMQASRAPVYTICEVICASMAAITHQFGKKRLATDRTVMMFHPASAGAQGQVANMANMVNFLQRFISKMETTVAARQGLTYEEYHTLVAYEYWIDSEDSLKAKVVDELVDVTVAGGLDIGNSSEKKNIKIANPSPAIKALDIRWIMPEKYNELFPASVIH